MPTRHGALPMLGAAMGGIAGLWQLSLLRYGLIASDQQLAYWAFFVGLGALAGVVAALVATALGRAIGRRTSTGLGFLGIVALFAIFVPWNARDLPHVLLVVTDTTRADHLSLYGYERETTPHLEELAKQSVVFTNAMAQGASTIVTTPCLLASCYPSDHGMDDYRAVLSDRFQLVSEILRESGYSTFAVVTNPHLDAKSGYAQGFDVYERIGRGTEQAVYADTVHVRASSILDTLAGPSNPWFGFLFYTDPHAPYVAPEEYQRLYDPDWPEDEPTFLWQPKLDGQPDERTLFNLVAQYDATITYWDAEFREFLGELGRRDLWNDALLVYTSDHGEEFYEHGWGAHGHSLYEELVHVPLVMSFPVPVRLPALRRTHRRIDDIVSSVDVLPTLLDYLRIPTPPEARGRSAHDLAVGRKGDNDDRVAYLEQIVRNRHDIRAIRTRSHKCIMTLFHRGKVVLGEDMVFDLEKDPGETHNLFERMPEETTRLRELLASRVNEVTTSAIARSVETIEPDEAQLEELRALGYID